MNTKVNIYLSGENQLRGGPQAAPAHPPTEAKFANSFGLCEFCRSHLKTIDFPTSWCLIRCMALTDQDLKKIITATQKIVDYAVSELKEELSNQISHLPTKDEFFTMEDKVVHIVFPNTQMTLCLSKISTPKTNTLQ